MNKIVEKFELYGKEYRLETGELAKQTTGAVLVGQGDTTVLVTAVISNEEKNYDFFPLTVDYIEKMYAVGRIPGGYLKREARPSEKGTLTARMIDRPIRPGFADGFKREVHVVATTLVADQINPIDNICVMGASAALMIGDAPFDGPCACVRVGRDVTTGDFICNPTYEEQANSDLDLIIAGTTDYISMIEAGAKEISEEDMLAAMSFGQTAIAKFCEAQQRFLDKVNPQPLEYKVHQVDPSIAERIEPFAAEMSAALKDADKQARIAKAGLESSAVYVPCDLADPAWKDRLTEGGFVPGQKAFCSLLGISYYLDKDAFRSLLTALGSLLCDGSALCLDYPSPEDSSETRTNQALARGAGEQMKAQYTVREMETLLAECSFLVYEHLDHTAMTGQYFAEYNQSSPDHPLEAPKGVCYLLAVRKST